MITEYGVKYADGKVFDISENVVAVRACLVDAQAIFDDSLFDDEFLAPFAGAHLVVRSFETDSDRPADDNGWEAVVD